MNRNISSNNLKWLNFYLTHFHYNSNNNVETEGSILGETSGIKFRCSKINIGTWIEQEYFGDKFVRQQKTSLLCHIRVLNFNFRNSITVKCICILYLCSKSLFIAYVYNNAHTFMQQCMYTLFKNKIQNIFYIHLW